MRNLEKNSLLYHSFQENKLMLSKQCICWLGNVRHLLKACNSYLDVNHECLQIEDITDSTTVIGDEIEDKIKELYNRQFTMDLDHDYAYGDEQNKLRTYRKFKRNIEREKYLTYINNYKLRKNICRLRISSHNLPIETGRHRRPNKVPSHLRICNECNTGKIGDEYHIMIECTKYRIARAILFTDIIKLRGEFREFSDENRFIEIMKLENEDIINLVLKYFKKIISIRGEF